MTIRHHVTDDLLLAYAAGSLSEGWSLAVATHLALCPDCRGRESRFQALGGAVLEEFAPAAIADDALAACLSRLDERVPAEPPHLEPARQAMILPQPLRDYAGGDADAVRWSMVGGGIRQCLLSVRSRERARLLYIPAGESVPEHGHRGMELTLVLAGSFADGGSEFRRGDIEVADEQLSHTPVAGYGEPCICLAVTDAPLIFRSLMPRLVQRFVRI
ncbi:MAG TPA: ChrR family anti-sigma-E factor [Alphaproteobacteria bacterium]|nr:ChrR family anti-sigma-E factor [Alphaproteobacteria bacterium]